MVTPEIYMAANAPTVAEGALLDAFWYGTPWQTTIDLRIEHAAQYGVPRDAYRARILSYLNPALNSVGGFTTLLRRNMWHSPGPQNVRAYLARDWETSLTPAQVLNCIRRST